MELESGENGGLGEGRGEQRFWSNKGETDGVNTVGMGKSGWDIRRQQD